MFTKDSHEAVLVCTHVLEGAPILYVAHDSDGDWQFLCGSDSHEESDARVAGLGHLIEADESLIGLASMCTGHHAERESRAAPWKQHDDHETFITECIRDPGWSVQLLPWGESDDEPSFAYTIGLFHNYRHPELIVLGLRTELMHSMLNTIAERIKAGATFKVGDQLAEVIEGYEVTLREVRTEESFARHVGYARWFYSGRPFPLFQVVWPDKQSRFPGEAGTSEAFERQQPLLP